ncbi:MAG TPA: 8-oxo-dGTP diphosphatase MutT [bacterium]|nr:8-oxo-dGTP diphosphatase MutT [bacterium]
MDKLLKIVAGVIVDDSNKILLAQRNDGKNMAGKWEFPGGKVEAGETKKEALRRELREELDIECKIGDYIGSSVYNYDDFTVDLHLYFADILDGEIQAVEHKKIAWTEIDTIENYDIPQANFPLINKIRSKM